MRGDAGMSGGSKRFGISEVRGSKFDVRGAKKYVHYLVKKSYIMI